MLIFQVPSTISCLLCGCLCIGSSFFMLFLYPNAHSHDLLFLWLVNPDYLVVSLKWLNIVATLSLVFSWFFPVLSTTVSRFHGALVIYIFLLSLRAFILRDDCVTQCMLSTHHGRNSCNHNSVSCITGRPNYSLLFMCFSAALKYSVALCQQKCKRRGTLESNYCSSNFGKVAGAI